MVDIVSVVMEQGCCDRRDRRKCRGINGGRKEKRGKKGKQRRRKETHIQGQREKEREKACKSIFINKKF